MPLPTEILTRTFSEIFYLFGRASGRLRVSWILLLPSEDATICYLWCNHIVLTLHDYWLPKDEPILSFCIQYMNMYTWSKWKNLNLWMTNLNTFWLNHLFASKYHWVYVEYLLFKFLEKYQLNYVKIHETNCNCKYQIPNIPPRSPSTC